MKQADLLREIAIGIMYVALGKGADPVSQWTRLSARSRKAYLTAAHNSLTTAGPIFRNHALEEAASHIEKTMGSMTQKSMYGAQFAKDLRSLKSDTCI